MRTCFLFLSLAFLGGCYGEMKAGGTGLWVTIDVTSVPEDGSVYGTIAMNGAMWPVMDDGETSSTGDIVLSLNGLTKHDVGPTLYASVADLDGDHSLASDYRTFDTEDVFDADGNVSGEFQCVDDGVSADLDCRNCREEDCETDTGDSGGDAAEAG